MHSKPKYQSDWIEKLKKRLLDYPPTKDEIDEIILRLQEKLELRGEYINTYKPSNTETKPRRRRKIKIKAL